MECEYCERTFQKLPYERVLRGKRYIFCGEGCFNLWLYKWPKFDINAMYRELMYPVPGKVFDEALEEGNE
ncbi:hypothetical protein ACFLVP_04400 [Chloroflexota bacterium]